MRKSFIFAFALAAGLLSSCSSDDTISAEGPNPAVEDGSDLVPVEIGVSNKMVVSTRGTGTVGTVATGSDPADIAKKQWQGQLVNVYMFKKCGPAQPKLSLAQFVSADADLQGIIYENTEMQTPDTQTNPGETLAVRTDHNVKYYPTTGNFEFWGYRLDDAVTTGPATVLATAEDVAASSAAIAEGDTLAFKVGFTIDGTQDVMAAKATPSDEISLADKLGATKATNYFSAYSARNGVQPFLNFKHQLTRLAFEIKDATVPTQDEIDAAGGDPIASSIKVVDVAVGSATEGEMVIAYADSYIQERENVVEFPESGTTEKYLSLKKRDVGVIGQNNNLVPLTIDVPDVWTEDNATLVDPSNVAKYITLHKNEALPVGEALLLAPCDTFPVRLTLCQKVQKTEAYYDEGGSLVDPTFAEVIYKIEGNITLPKVDGQVVSFKKGTSYLVTITVYGLQKIEINTTLTPWEDGGNVSVDPEDDALEIDNGNNGENTGGTGEENGEGGANP